MDKERGEKQVKQTSEKKYSTDVDGNKNPDTNIEPIPENEAGIPESASDSFSCRKTENSLKRAAVLPQIPNESEQYSADEDGQEEDPDQKTKEISMISGTSPPQMKLGLVFSLFISVKDVCLYRKSVQEFRYNLFSGDVVSFLGLDPQKKLN